MCVKNDDAENSMYGNKKRFRSSKDHEHRKDMSEKEKKAAIKKAQLRPRPEQEVLIVPFLFGCHMGEHHAGDR